MNHVGQILAYKVGQEGTALQIVIPNVNLMEDIEGRNIRRCEIRMDDGRRISAEQRKKAYATIADIARYTGELPEVMKEWLKYLHIARTGSPYFSLSNCSVDTARSFINTLMDYALEHGVILDDTGINRTDDISCYLYACLMHKKCAVCGRDGELHHWDTIGMGNDRRKADDSGHRKICLCRAHHMEAHSIGREEFTEKYKVYGIVINAQGWIRVATGQETAWKSM